MKRNLIMLLGFSSVLLAGCGMEQALQKTQKEAPNVDSDYTYLADGAESAASTDDAADSAGAVDSTVEQNVTSERIESMAKKMLADLDSDASGNLSLEEFLVGPKKFQERAPQCKLDSLTEEQKASMTEKLTAEFVKNAGDDSLLSLEEIKTLLLAQAPRVAKFRRGGEGHPPGGKGDKGRGHGGKQHKGGERPPPPSVADIYTKYDKDGDGKLSQAEFDQMMADRRADEESHRKE